MGGEGRGPLATASTIVRAPSTCCSRPRSKTYATPSPQSITPPQKNPIILQMSSIDWARAPLFATRWRIACVATGKVSSTAIAGPAGKSQPHWSLVWAWDGREDTQVGQQTWHQCHRHLESSKVPRIHHEGGCIIGQGEGTCIGRAWSLLPSRMLHNQNSREALPLGSGH